MVHGLWIIVHRPKAGCAVDRIILYVYRPLDKNMTEQKPDNADQYRALFEQASDFIIVTDFSGKLIDANASMCQRFGYSKEELLQMHVSELIDPSNYRDSPIKWDMLKQGTHVFSERLMVLKDGGIIEVEANVKKFSPTSIMAIIREVTEKNKAKASLQKAYERLNYHLTNTPLAVIEEDKDLHITQWNKQAEQIFGWKAEEVMGKRIVDFMVHEDDKEMVHGIINNLNKGIIYKQPNENRNYTKDGRTVYCQWYHSLLRDEHGNVETVLSIIRDITDIRVKEEQLQQYLELMKELSFVTSHELRSEYVKVQSVLNYLESAQEEGRELDAKDRSFLLKEATQSFYNINDAIGKLNAKISSGPGLTED
jgi:PAS domain S-box-containing protein